VQRIPQADIDALEAILDTWTTGETEAIGWAASLCDGIARRFEGQELEHSSALRIVALAAGALPRLQEDVSRAKREGDASRSASLEEIGSRLQAAARALLPGGTR
jgi:hypothetical protein